MNGMVQQYNILQQQSWQCLFLISFIVWSDSTIYCSSKSRQCLFLTSFIVFWLLQESTKHTKFKLRHSQVWQTQIKQEWSTRFQLEKHLTMNKTWIHFGEQQILGTVSFGKQQIGRIQRRVSDTPSGQREFSSSQQFY